MFFLQAIDSIIINPLLPYFNTKKITLENRIQRHPGFKDTDSTIIINEEFKLFEVDKDFFKLYL